MMFPYIAGMLTMFGLFIVKEMFGSPKFIQNQNIYIINETYFILQTSELPIEFEFPYETTYLRSTLYKYQEFDDMVKTYMKNYQNPVCTQKDFEYYNNVSNFMCW